MNTSKINCKTCIDYSEWKPREESQSIEFKRLNGLTPTVESCTIKVLSSDEIRKAIQEYIRNKIPRGDYQLVWMIDATKMSDGVELVLVKLEEQSK